jgi:type IV pilus assembly protein PilM
VALLKTITSPEGVAEVDQERSLSRTRQGLSSRWVEWLPFRRAKPILGLDIGSHSIKVVVLVRRRNRIELKEAALAETPPRALTNGVLTDGLILSERLRSLRAMFHLQTSRVAVAAGGDKVYCQADSVRDEEGDGFYAVVENAAQAVVPYPLASAAFDYQEIHRDPDSSRRTVLWVSSAPEQVDWLRQTVSLAGMTPVVVDVEACALANTFAYNYQPPAEEISVLLHAGARHVTIALLRGESLVYSRGVLIGKRWMAHESPALADRLALELDRHWDELSECARPDGLRNLYLSGGPARDPALAVAVGRHVGLRAEVLDPFHRIDYITSTEAGRIAGSHGPALAVAVGLALRSFTEL